MKRLAAVGFCLLLAVVLPLVLAGCGGDESTAAELTKAEFIKQADAICDKADQVQKAELNSYLKENPKATSSPAKEEEMVVAVGLPPIGDEAEELDELGVPSGDEEEVAAIVEGIEDALEQSEADPKPLTEGNEGAFVEVDKLAKEYGLKSCSSAL